MPFKAGLWLAGIDSQIRFVLYLFRTHDFRLSPSESEAAFKNSWNRLKQGKKPGSLLGNNKKFQKPNYYCLKVCHNVLWSGLEPKYQMSNIVVCRKDNTGKNNSCQKVKTVPSDFRSNGFLSRITVIKISMSIGENDFGGKKGKRTVCFTKHHETLFYSEFS